MDATAEVRQSFERLTERQQHEFYGCLAADSRHSGQPCSPALEEMVRAVEHFSPRERAELFAWVEQHVDAALMAQVEAALNGAREIPIWLFHDVALVGTLDEDSVK